MSNKLELQNNNIDLQGILTKVNTLPKKENIDEEVDTIENLTEQIKLALEGKAAGGKIFAAIGVTYPEGSVCTCTNGTKTMEAGNTNGQWVFAIPEAGEWTVAANDRSEIVNITEEGQVEKLNLVSLYIFKSGSGFADGYSLIGKSYAYPQFWDWTPNITDSYIENTEGGDRTWGVAELIDLGEYKTLKARVLLTDVGLNGGAKMVLGVTKTQLSGTTLSETDASSEIGSESVGTETIISVDISAIDGSYYVNWDMKYVMNRVYDMWLE